MDQAQRARLFAVAVNQGSCSWPAPPFCMDLLETFRAHGLFFRLTASATALAALIFPKPNQSQRPFAYWPRFVPRTMSGAVSTILSAVDCKMSFTSAAV